MSGQSRLPLLLGAGAAVIGLSLGISSSCTQMIEPSLPAKETEGKPAAKAQEPTSKNETPQANKKGSTYADAIRRRQFQRALELIDQATDEEQTSPEVRYARARAALEVNEIETVLRIADELEKSSPQFSQEAAALRLAAAKKSQDVTLLVHFLGSSRSVDDRLLVAEAHASSSSSREARKIADNVLVSLEKSKRKDKLELSARARLIKAKTLAAEGEKTKAAREYHWLATRGASLDEKGEFAAEVLSLDPTKQLNSKERLIRIEAFSEKGWVEQTEHEIEELKKLSPAAASGKTTDHLLAWAVYKSRTDYERAAQLFAAAAAHGGKDRKKHLYYEAKALARSHQDHQAIAKYEAVEALGGTYADHAGYQAARLKFIDGQWKEAVKAYSTYLKKYGRTAKHREAAQADLPIARLAAGDYANADRELSTRLKDEDSQRQRARLMQLQGVARLGAKKEAEAAGIFRRVIEYRPLSLPALLAAARLREMGQGVPPIIAPAKTASAVQPLAISLPEKVWRLSRVGLDSEAESAMRGHESLLRKKYGSRSGEALCRAYGQLESARRRYQVAQTAASWSVLSRAPGPGTEWQWDCIYPTPYKKIVNEEAERQKISPSFVYAVMRQESAFRPTVVSPANAVGLMQIIPPTAQKIAASIDAQYSPDLMRAPAVNVTFGTYYLRYLLDIFGNRPELAAASYNAGPQAVTRWLRAGEKLPLDLFVARIPYKETRNYVYRVMGNYARYAYREESGEIPEIDLQLPTGLKAPEDAY